AIAVVDAVDHRRQPFDIGLRAGAAARVENDRPGSLLGQPSFDLPYQLLAFCRIGLGGLPVDQLVDLRIAIAGVVPYRPAHEVLVELLVGVVDTALGAIDRDRSPATSPAFPAASPTARRAAAASSRRCRPCLA